ncbi:MAG: hypothetical protein U5R06_19920 [candidate division KSB1 bacterium]|nr:hypothetical protein [candidate division KSB1 bacterium]
MKPAVLFTLTIILLTGTRLQSQMTPDTIIDECLTYHMIYKGLHVADSQLLFSQQNPDTFLISWYANTRSIFYLLFPLENLYRVYWSPSLELYKMEKRIRQKNIDQDWIIHYNRQQHYAVTNNGKRWEIDPACRSLLGMVYYVRLYDPDLGDSFSFVADIESECWQVSGTTTAAVQEYDSIIKPERDILLTFKPLNDTKNRSWNSDLFTNNVSRENACLHIKLGPSPQSVPTMIAFENTDKPVRMQLVKVEDNL